MTNLERLMTVAAFAFGVPTAALAQPATPPHQHGQPATAAQPAQAHQQHQGSASGQQGQQQQGDHQAGCQCPCCQVMMQMMQQHGGQQPGSMQNMNMMQGHGAQQPGATQGNAEEHEQHRRQRPN